MNLKKAARLTLVPFAVFLLNAQCSDDPEKQSVTCDCTIASVAKKQKDVEAVVAIAGGNQMPDMYILSTEPKDFETTSHHAGENILVPCDSLPAQYRKAGLRLVISYRRKVCYGAVTSPVMRGAYGYYIDLTSVRTKP